MSQMGERNSCSFYYTDLGYSFHTNFQVRPVCVTNLRFLILVKVYRGHTMYQKHANESDKNCIILFTNFI